jgi:hypothetical protein
MDALDIIACSSSSSASRARGLLQNLQLGSTIAGLKFTQRVLVVLENLCKTVQSPLATMTGMLQSVALVKEDIMRSRSDIEASF